MKGIILLAEYFEDVEALITIDMLRRAKIDITLVSMNKDLNVLSQSNINYTCDKNYQDIVFSDFDFLIIPGGKATFLTHHSSSFTRDAVKSFMERGCLVATICAAPSILGILGYLDNLEFTCFPSCEVYMPKGIYKQEEDVVVSGNIISSKAAGTTFKFAYEIIKYLLNDEVAKKTLESVYYNF